MNFDDAPHEAEFRAEARAWIESAIPGFFESSGFHAIDPKDFGGLISATLQWQRLKWAGGWGCLTWPKEHGGRNLSLMEASIFAQEEIKYIDPGSLILTMGMAAPTILAHGTEEQKEEHLPHIAQGEKSWCQLFSEPAAGSDLAGIRTRAVLDGDDWVVNGQKVWTTFAQFSDWAILVTRTDPDVEKHKGLTYFVVDMSSPGIEVRPIKQASGDSEFNEVFLTDVRIPDRNRLGAVGEGWRVALTTLMNERVAVGGGFPDNFDDALSLAISTPLDDGMAIDDGGVRQRLADWYVQSRGSKNIQLRHLSAVSKGGVPGPESSVLKLVLGVGRQDLAADAMDILDMAGVLAGEDALGWGDGVFFRSIGNRLEGGTDEILRNIIGERVLGLPTEPRADKGVPFSRVPSGH